MVARRNQRSGVEDRWHKTVIEEQEDGTKIRQKVPSANYGCAKRWRARYVDDHGVEHVQGFRRKTDAEQWLTNQMSTVVQGTHVAPRDAAITVQQWCDQWIAGYEIHRKGTVREAKTHIKRITSEFGNVQLSAVRPSSVKAWVAKLKREGLKASYIYALHGRLSQIMSDAWHDGLIARNPCSSKTSPPMGKQKPYIMTTEQVWALYEAFPRPMRAAVLLGAFAGLRVAEVSGLRVKDIDFMRGIITPAQQWPDEPLKSETSETPIPIPRELTLLLSASNKRWPHEHMVTNGEAQPAPPWQIERALRDLREDDEITGLPEEFSFHDLRHYFASLLISKKADVKTVQARLRHASARTTLDTYGHLWPDADESTRTAIGEVIAERMDSRQATADELRTNDGR